MGTILVLAAKVAAELLALNELAAKLQRENRDPTPEEIEASRSRREETEAEWQRVINS